MSDEIEKKDEVKIPKELLPTARAVATTLATFSSQPELWLPPTEKAVLEAMRSDGAETRVVYMPETKKVRIYFKARLERGDSSCDELSVAPPFDNLTLNVNQSAADLLAGQLGKANPDHTKAAQEIFGDEDSDRGAVVIADRPSGAVLFAMRAPYEDGFPFLFSFSAAEAHELAGAIHAGSVRADPSVCTHDGSSVPPAPSSLRH